MQSRALLKLGAILIGTTAMLFIFRERILTGYDPANFVLSLKYGYNVFQRRPHPPGYPAFYLIWELIAIITRWSPLLIIEMVNIFFVLIAIAATYFVALRLYGERAAALCALMIATNPVLLYFGCTSEISVFDAAMGAFLAMMLLCPPSSLEMAIYFAYGVSGSFRLSSFLLTLPIVAIVFLYRSGKNIWSLKKMWTVFAMIGAGVLVWFVPYVIYIGGVDRFWKIMNIAADVPAVTLVQNLSTFAIVTIWMFSVALVAVVVFRKRLIWLYRAKPEVYSILFLMVAVPAFFFALKYYAKGYALIYLPAVTIVLAGLIEDRKAERWLRVWIVLNVILFVLFPFVTPPPSVALRLKHRSITQRAEDMLSRSISVFAPTLSHLYATDNAMADAAHLIDGMPRNGTVIVDNEGAFWAYPRTLQAMRPDLRFMMITQDPKTLLEYYADSLVENVAWPRKEAVYYLTGSERIVSNDRSKLWTGQKSGHLTLFEIPRDSFDELRRYLDALR